MEHRPLIDRLTDLQIEKKDEHEKVRPVEPSEEEIQGLRYRKGERVIDSVTGKEVVILGGKRAIGSV